MPVDYAYATPVTLPLDSGITRVYPSVHLADAFAIQLPPTASRDPEVLARFMFAHQPAWIAMLMSVRDTIVSWFGLKTGKHLATLAEGARAERVGIFKVYSKNDTEIVLGEDDKHLDFRVSILCAGTQLTVSTVVHCHNRLGRTYLLIIAPFHRMVVKASLRRAAHRLAVGRRLRRAMSRAAFSAKVFSVYLFILAAMLVVAPNFLLTLFGLPPTSEVWIRVIGLLVLNIGVFAWTAARHEDRHFFAASVYTRGVVFVALTAFAVLGLASPMIIIFGAVDLLGGLWTYAALKADARAAP